MKRGMGKVDSTYELPECPSLAVSSLSYGLSISTIHIWTFIACRCNQSIHLYVLVSRIACYVGGMVAYIVSQSRDVDCRTSVSG